MRESHHTIAGPVLVLFTLEYPYGKAETFLESEITFLSEQFAQVFVVPSSNASASKRRATPGNVVVIDDVANVKRAFSLWTFMPFIAEFATAWSYCFWWSQKKKNYLRFIKSLMHHYYNDVAKRAAIAWLVESRDLHNAIFYDYWLVNSSLSLLSLKKCGKIKTTVCRSHRFDLYDEAAFEGVIPFREWIVRGMDRVFVISNHGKEYLLDKSHPKFHSKISLQYLGVNAPASLPAPNGQAFVVSCSSVIAVKQVDKIALALRSVGVPFTWIHFGDGPELRKIQDIAAIFPGYINVELRGFVANRDVLAFYEGHYVACVVSLSKSEGLPVSMMEAQSFGIPIVAPPINGIPEIVNERTGYLLGANWSISEVTDVVEKILRDEIRFDRDNIREFFSERFNASRNYRTFAQTLASLYA